MGNSKIGTFGAIALILTSIVTHTVLSLTKNLLNTTKSATLINIIYVGVIVLLLTVLIIKLFRKFPRYGYFRYFEFFRREKIW